MIKKITVLVLVALIFSCLFSPLTNIVYASNISIDGGYTTVLEDLTLDENFNAEDYPIIEKDYSLQVIQIAESSDKELFVYVYQPNEDCGEYTASTINISQSLHNRNNIKNYKLTLLNYVGTLQKYLVNGLTIEDTEIRYYDVVSIYRVFNEDIDEGLSDDNENIINEVVFKVAKQYTIQTTNDGQVNLSMTETEFETIEIIDKYVGFVRYMDGFDLNLYNNACDSHFIAFSTDKPINKLYEVDVYYTIQSCDWIWNTATGREETTFGIQEDKYSYLNHQQNASHTTSGIGGHTYDWKRITPVADFKAEENRDLIYQCGLFDVRLETGLTDEGLIDIESQQWVIRFVETDYSNGGIPGAHVYENKTIVGNVTILRLAFETDGIFYNLPAIDNKQTGDGVPDNYTSFSMEISDMFKSLMLILLLILLVVVLAPFLPTLISFVLWVIKTALKIVVLVISLPFKLFDKRE